MKSIRKWFCKPKRSDQQLLAQFYFANEELNEVSQELDSFDGRQDPERCTTLVNHLRRCQDKVLAIVGQIMVEAIPNARANRDYRAKFPEDVLLDSLPGQLWFGAECLGAGSTIMNREIESAALRPLARGLTKTLDTMRMILKEQCYDNLNEYSDKVKDILKKFDETFAEFELSYVSTMVPVKSTREYDTQQDVIVLFCETLNRALEQKLLTQDQVDDYDPGLMFTIPRLAIVCGLVVFPEGPLNVEKKTFEVSELFRPFQALLHKIKELLQTLSEEELHLLEKALCSSDGSWEDIEQQLKLMGKGSKVRCNAAVQTDPLEMSSTEKKNKGDADGNFLMFGMSPVEEVKGHVESEVNILGTSPDEDINQGKNGLCSLPSPHAGETIEDGTESNSSGIEEDNHREDDGISSPSEKSPGDLSNGDIFDDVDSHTLGMSATEQKVQYSVSPKHRSIVLKKPLLDRINTIGHDTMSHVYGMSPVEPNRPGFDRHSPIFGMSPLDSPILDSYAVAQARSDVLGMSPVDSVPMVACKVMPDLEVDKTWDRCHCEAERVGTHATSEDQNNSLKCNHCDPRDPVGSGDLTYNKKTVKKPPETNFNQGVDGVNYIETILKEIKGAENHTDSNNQGEDSCSVQSQDKTAILKLCQELVDDIVSYAVQYSTFTSQHLGGRCLAGLKLSSDNHEVSPICQSCAKDSNAKDKPEELYCQQCKPKERSGSPLYQDGTTKSSETKVVKDEFVDPLKQVVSDSKPRPTTIGNVSVLSLEHTKDNHDDGQNGSVAKQLKSKCTCAIAPSSDNNTKCSSSVMASPKALIGAGDAQMANATEAPPSDDSTIRCSKCLSPLTNSTLQDTEVVHSTDTMQTSKAVGGTPESASWNTKEASWESPIFGKGKPSTELSQVIPQSERLSLHGDASGQSMEASSDSSISIQNEPGNSSRSHSSYQVSSPSSGRVYPASAINRVTGSRGLVPEAALGEDDPGRDRRESNVSIAICSSCGGELVDDDDIYQWESEDSDSDSTSSMSDNDEHEIAIAIQAAELSARQEARSHFSSSWDLVHRLFVCIAGVADQLQTNYASDLRNILKTVFEITANPHKPIEESEVRPSQDVGSSEVVSPSAEEQASPGEDENRTRTSAANIQEGTPVPEFSPEVDYKNPTENQTQIAHNNAQEENTDTPSIAQAPLENEIKAEGGLSSPVQERTVVYDNHQKVCEDSQSEMQQPKCNDITHEGISFENIPKESLNNAREIKDKPHLSPVGESHDEDLQAQLIQQDCASSDLQQSETETNLKVVTSRPGEAGDKLVNKNLSEVQTDNHLGNQTLPEVEADDKLVNKNLPEVEADDKLVKENLPDVEANDKSVSESLPEVETDQTKEISEVEAVNDSEQKDHHQEQSETKVADNQQTTTDEQAFSPKYPEIGSDDEASFDRQQTLTADNQHEELLHMKLHQNNNDSEEDVFDILQQEMPAGATAQDLSVAERILEGSTSKGHEMAFDHQVESTGRESSPAVKPKKKRHRSGDLLSRRVGQLEEPPLWVPDEECSQCTSCQAVFTMIRRKHHCRNCGKIFCSRCSANCVPLPRFGQEKPVRVCNKCYMFQVTPFQH